MSYGNDVVIDNKLVNGGGHGGSEFAKIGGKYYIDGVEVDPSEIPDAWREDEVEDTYMVIGGRYYKNGMMVDKSEVPCKHREDCIEVVPVEKEYSGKTDLSSLEKPKKRKSIFGGRALVLLI